MPKCATSDRNGVNPIFLLRREKNTALLLNANQIKNCAIASEIYNLNFLVEKSYKNSGFSLFSTEGNKSVRGMRCLTTSPPGAPVAHGGDPQDRAGLPLCVYAFLMNVKKHFCFLKEGLKLRTKSSLEPMVSSYAKPIPPISCPSLSGSYLL